MLDPLVLIARRRRNRECHQFGEVGRQRALELFGEGVEREQGAGLVRSEGEEGPEVAQSFHPGSQRTPHCCRHCVPFDVPNGSCRRGEPADAHGDGRGSRWGAALGSIRGDHGRDLLGWSGASTIGMHHRSEQGVTVGLEPSVRAEEHWRRPEVLLPEE